MRGASHTCMPKSTMRKSVRKRARSGGMGVAARVAFLCVSYGSAHSHWRRLSYLRAQMPIFPTTVDGPLSGLLPRATASSRCAAPASRRSESSRGTMKEAAIEKLKTVNGRRKSTIIMFSTYFFLPSLPSSVRRLADGKTSPWLMEKSFSWGK